MDVSSASVLIETYLTLKIVRPKVANTQRRYLEIDYQRYSAILSERSFRFMGRNIDILQLVSSSMNTYLRSDLEYILYRTEVQGISASHELELGLQTLKDTHRTLSNDYKLLLDDFCLVVEQIDGRVSGQSNLKTRISKLVSREILCDILPNCSYNSVTERFIHSPTLTNPEYSRTQNPNRKPPKVPAVNFWYPASCRDAFQKAHNLELEFFGVYHLDSLFRAVELTSKDTVCTYPILLASHFCELICEKLLALARNSIIPITLKIASKFKKLMSIDDEYSGFKVFMQKNEEIKTFLYSEEMKAVLLNDEEYKKFIQALREFGNGLCLIRLIHISVSRLESEQFHHTCHLTGLDSFSFQVPESILPPQVDSTPGIQNLKADFTIEDEQYIRDSIELNLQSFRACALMPNCLRILAREFHTALNSSELFSSFPRIFNYFQFLYAKTAGGIKTSKPPVEDDETEYGEGFLWAGYFIIFCQKAKSRFDLMDYCVLVSRTDLLERSQKSDEGSIKEQNATSNFTEFLKCVRDTIEPTKALVFSLLSRVLEDDDEEDIEGQTDKIVLFQPPGNYFEENGEPKSFTQVITPVSETQSKPSEEIQVKAKRRAPVPPPTVSGTSPQLVTSHNIQSRRLSHPPGTVQPQLTVDLKQAPPPPISRPLPSPPKINAPVPPPPPPRTVEQPLRFPFSGSQQPPAPPPRRFPGLEESTVSADAPTRPKRPPSGSLSIETTEGPPPPPIRKTSSQDAPPPPPRPSRTRNESS